MRPYSQDLRDRVLAAVDAGGGPPRWPGSSRSANRGSAASSSGGPRPARPPRVRSARAAAPSTAAMKLRSAPRSPNGRAAPSPN